MNSTLGHSVVYLGVPVGFLYQINFSFIHSFTMRQWTVYHVKLQLANHTLLCHMYLKLVLHVAKVSVKQCWSHLVSRQLWPNALRLFD